MRAAALSFRHSTQLAVTAARCPPVALGARRCGGASASTGSSPPPPAAEQAPPPPASAASSAEGEAAAPGSTQQGRYRCGGFFFSVDPNIGLWNDRQNPNWRFTFTDSQTGEKQRLPYSFSIQQRGPHAELALRFQLGYVSCDSTFEAPPSSFEVESGWELTIPLIISGIRLSHTVVRASGGSSGPTQAAVWCVDNPFGLCLGFQRVVSGVGVRGAPELSWRGEVAMVGFVVATLWAGYGLANLPSTWQEFIEVMTSSDEEFDARMAFEALDVDGDGRLSREDVRAFCANTGLSNNPAHADQIFELMDTLGTGSVDFDSFRAFMEQAGAEGLFDALADESGQGAAASLGAGGAQRSGAFGSGAGAPLAPLPFMPGMLPPTSLGQSILDANRFRRGPDGGIA
eukprot:TRINITY_DN19198_c0_g1_i1.p1 TRINITY_DN19198_c0_g1~~TRINITY_DN19198_c0_g1_i1.p1  ORF type:complete len:401 (-),score=78.93 TRINITY_DN19198_c0_g1_i1:112-1314(-)